MGRRPANKTSAETRQKWVEAGRWLANLFGPADLKLLIA